MATPSISRVALFLTWADELHNRPFDIPRYLAFHGVPTILIYFSSASLPDEGVLVPLLARGSEWRLFVSAFLDGDYPVLRCNLSIPDNPGDPLVLETGLDLSHGDVQAFCEAALATDRVAIVVTHEKLNEDDCREAAFSAPDLPEVLHRELERMAGRFTPELTRGHFDDAVEKMASVFPSPFHGLESAGCAPLIVDGEVSHRLISS